MNKYRFRFAAVPPIGLAVRLSGERFDLIAAERFKREGGRSTKLLVWRGTCRDCGVAFETRTTAFRLPENRRCELHATRTKETAA